VLDVGRLFSGAMARFKGINGSSSALPLPASDYASNTVRKRCNASCSSDSGTVVKHSRAQLPKSVPQALPGVSMTPA
jgi:hypothetical protein